MILMRLMFLFPFKTADIAVTVSGGNDKKYTVTSE